MDCQEGAERLFWNGRAGEEGGEFAGRADESGTGIAGVEAVDEGGEGAAAGGAEEENLGFGGGRHFVSVNWSGGLRAVCRRRCEV